jgi:hypothetical protein
MVWHLELYIYTKIKIINFNLEIKRYYKFQCNYQKHYLNWIIILKSTYIVLKCNKSHYEITYLCNKIIMHDIQKICLFIYFAILIYVSMWNGGWIVKALGCKCNKMTHD